jgi:hypothetical protein
MGEVARHLAGDPLPGAFAGWPRIPIMIASPPSGR